MSTIPALHGKAVSLAAGDRLKARCVSFAGTWA